MKYNLKFSVGCVLIALAVGPFVFFHYRADDSYDWFVKGYHILDGLVACALTLPILLLISYSPAFARYRAKDANRTNRAKDMFVDQLQKEREQFSVERQGYIQQLMSYTHKVGELETKLLQLGSGTPILPNENPSSQHIARYPSDLLSSSTASWAKLQSQDR